MNFGKNNTKGPFLVIFGLLSAIKQPKMVQLIRSKFQNYNLYVGNIFQDLEFLFQHFNCVHCERNDTNRPFLETCGWLSAIRQQKMVQFIISKIQNYNFYLGNSFKHPEFWFQHFKGVHFGKNDTKRPFLENCGLLSAIKQPKMVQLIIFQIQNYNSYVGNIFQ